MHDGWETRRRRGPGHDWAIVRLARRGIGPPRRGGHALLQGERPRRLLARGRLVLRRSPSRRSPPPDAAWEEILPRTPLEPDRGPSLRERGPRRRPRHPRAAQHLPGRRRRAAAALGGALRNRGVSAGLARLNALGPEEAERELRAFCGSSEWARRMARARPFDDAPHAVEAAERIWASLGTEDWLEAFRAHPRIGDRRGGRPRGRGAVGRAVRAGRGPRGARGRKPALRGAIRTRLPRLRERARAARRCSTFSGGGSATIPSRSSRSRRRSSVRSRDSVWKGLLAT